MSENKKYEALTESLKNYINTNIEIIKLEAIERSSAVGSGLISGLIIGFILFMFVFFLSLGLGYYLAECLNSFFLGFIIVSGIYFLLAIILILGRKKILETPIGKSIIKNLLNKN